jgi:hypothetical protein
LIVLTRKKISSTDIDRLITEKWWFPLILVILWLKNNHSRFIDRLMIEQLIFADIDRLMNQKDHFRWYCSTYNWKRLFHLVLFVFWMTLIISADIVWLIFEKIICANIDRLLIEKIDFLWYWSSYHWISSFPLILFDLWLKQIVSFGIDRLMIGNDHFHWYCSTYLWKDHLR